MIAGRAITEPLAVPPPSPSAYAARWHRRRACREHLLPRCRTGRCGRLPIQHPLVVADAPDNHGGRSDAASTLGQVHRHRTQKHVDNPVLTTVSATVPEPCADWDVTSGSCEPSWYLAGFGASCSAVIYVDDMTRSHIPLVAALLACLTLSACSEDKAAPAAAGAPSVSGAGEAGSSSDGPDLPVTKQLSRGELTQAIPDAEDVVPGYLPGSLHKRVLGEPDDCAPLDAPAPAGWQRAGSGDYDYQGSTVSRGIDLDVCQFGSVAHAKAAYKQWPVTDETAPLDTGRVGEESVFLAHTGSSGMVYGYSRTGTVIVRVKVEDAGADSTDAHDVLAATIRRLQQVQAGQRATATAPEIAAREQTHS